MNIDIIKISQIETIYIIHYNNIEKDSILTIIIRDNYKKKIFWRYKFEINPLPDKTRTIEYKLKPYNYN